MAQRQTILVVDDDKQLRLTLSLILEREGYGAETAENAEDALQRLKIRAYGLMFVDLNMPGMSGIDLLVEAHRTYPHMPVLILTAHATMETAIDAVRLGARDYMIKPFEPKLILTRAAEILAENEQPARRKELVVQLQNLLAELQRIDGADVTPTSALASVPPTDPSRFLHKGPFTLDLHARHVMLDEKYLPATGIYFDYLTTLLRHAPKPVSYKALVKEAQGFDVTLTEAKDLARWRIHELRKVIEPDFQNPQYILTVRGEGYRLAI